jgi:hypothetical protein
VRHAEHKKASQAVIDETRDAMEEAARDPPLSANAGSD